VKKGSPRAARMSDTSSTTQSDMSGRKKRVVGPKGRKDRYVGPMEANVDKMEG